MEIYIAKNSVHPENISFQGINISETGSKDYYKGSINLPSAFYYDTSSDNHRLSLVPIYTPFQAEYHDKYRISLSSSARNLTVFYLFKVLAYDKGSWGVPEGLLAGTKFTLVQFEGSPDSKNFEYPYRVDGFYADDGFSVVFNRALPFDEDLPVYMFLSHDLYCSKGIIADLPMALWSGVMVVLCSSESSSYKVDYCIYKVKEGTAPEVEL